MAEKDKYLRTAEVVCDDLTMIKPSDLIECVEMAPLTLADRRVYNMLLLNAWECVEKDKSHVIAKRELRGSHSVNDRVGNSVTRLMAVVCSTQIIRSGKSYTRRFHLLDTNDEENDNDDMGLLFYSFPAELRRIIKNSTQFARLKKEILFALSSKYAVSLYELIAKRINLKHKKSEEIPLDRFRALIGVEETKLKSFIHLRQRAIDPAVLEVNGLAEFGCKVEPVYTGRKVTAVKLSWWSKTVSQKMDALREVKGSKVGRKARLAGTVETLTIPPIALPELKPEAPQKGYSHVSYAKAVGLHPSQLDGLRLKTKTFELAREIAPGLDIYYLESEWREWAAGKEAEIKSPDAAFLGWIRRKATQHKG